MTYTTLLTIVIAIVIVTMALGTIFLFHSSRLVREQAAAEGRPYVPQLRKPTTSFLIGCVCITVAFVVAFSFSMFRSHLEARGWNATANLEDSTTVSELADKAATTFVDESAILDTASKPTITIVYRWGCPDCEATYPTLSAWYDQIKNEHPDISVLAVSSRSARGMKLVEDANVQEVPSIAVVHRDGSATSYVAYTSRDGNTAVREDALSAALNDALSDIASATK